MIWVIDASVALRWFLEEESNPNADDVLEAVIDAPENFAVPELFAFEVYSVLQRLHPDGLEVYNDCIIPLLQGGILRHPMTEELARGAGAYVKSGLTGYDACYAALAEDLQGKWLTFDSKAHQLIHDKNVSVSLMDGMPEGL